VNATARPPRLHGSLALACRWLGLALVLVWSPAAAQAEAPAAPAPTSSGQPRVTVTRGERTVEVIQGTAGSDGARTVLANRNCEPGVLTNIFYGPVAGFVQTRIDETHLQSQIAIVRIPQGTEEDAGETVELIGGALRFDRPGCIETLDRNLALTVQLRQGRTNISGSRFFLDRGTDIAEMTGPIELERPQDGNEGEPLRASAESMTYDLEREVSTLIGTVVVKSGERVSQADRLELDEEAGVAILLGSPATSRRGSDEIRGNTLRYDLETDEVVAIGRISASFEVDLGED
jgi:lipopolysaccharide export system protein LptA